MITRFTLLALTLALLVAAEADTLRLRSGATITGTWLGGTADEVRFMVDDQVKTYSRSNVLGVDFTSDGVVTTGAPAPAAPPPPSAPVQPNVVGVPFMRGAYGLISLEAAYAMPVRSNSMYGMMGPTIYRIQGPPQSPVRVRRGDNIVFVLRLNSGGDPRRFELYLLESRMGYRQTQPSMGGRPPALPVTITKTSDTTYEISPARPLYPGEYSLSSIGMNQSYCFGVDY
jgi:hypothetical protein